MWLLRNKGGGTSSHWPGGVGRFQARTGSKPRRPNSQHILLWKPESWNIVLKQLLGYLKTFWCRQHVDDDDLTFLHMWVICSLYCSVSQELQIVLTYVSDSDVTGRSLLISSWHFEKYISLRKLICMPYSKMVHFAQPLFVTFSVWKNI